MIYLCGSCASDRRTFIKKIAKELEKYDEVYCPFEQKIENAWSYSQEEWARLVFNKDIDAIKRCDLVVAISEGRISSAGTNWEIGYAYGIFKHVIVFQITDAPTSLMTYWGCHKFISTTQENVISDIAKVFTSPETEELPLKTVLT